MKSVEQMKNKHHIVSFVMLWLTSVSLRAIWGFSQRCARRWNVASGSQTCSRHWNIWSRIFYWVALLEWTKVKKLGLVQCSLTFLQQTEESGSLSILLGAAAEAKVSLLTNKIVLVASNVRLHLLCGFRRVYDLTHIQPCIIQQNNC